METPSNTNVPKLTHEATENLNTPISTKEMESVIKNFLAKKKKTKKGNLG